MGIRLFEECDLDRIENGYVSVGDLTGLDPDRDRLLIEYLVRHLPDRFRSKAMRRYGMKELPEEMINPDDPDDEVYRTYFILQEQVQRENDREVLRAAAFSDWISSASIRKFAFSRLTGYMWPAPANDAYSYRTYDCGLKSDMLREDIVDLCMEMVITNGPFASEAEEWLDDLKSVSDEMLDEWASVNTEREPYRSAREAMGSLLQPADGNKVLDGAELAQKIRSLADAYILLLYEEQNGRLPRRERFRVADQFIREAYKAYTHMARYMINDVAEAAKAGLITGQQWNESISDEKIRDIVWSEAEDSPLHGWFLELAKQHGIR
ncbi:MAG: hypothetical protein IJH90_00930 [Mogibacterium sp.]|nr:hypothetical protein [Mogibacterium sp.]